MDDKGKLGPLVSPEYIKKLRSSLGLTQAQFAVLMEVGNVTISHWEKEGMDGVRCSNYTNFRALVALLRQASEHPEFLPMQKLLWYLELASRHELMVHYLENADVVVPDFLNLINTGSIMGVVFALLLDIELKKRGIPTPYEKNNLFASGGTLG